MRQPALLTLQRGTRFQQLGHFAKGQGRGISESLAMLEKGQDWEIGELAWRMIALGIALRGDCAKELPRAVLDSQDVALGIGVLLAKVSDWGMEGPDCV